MAGYKKEWKDFVTPFLTCDDSPIVPLHLFSIILHSLLLSITKYSYFEIFIALGLGIVGFRLFQNLNELLDYILRSN